MSKLAHSHQPTMDEIDRLRAVKNGDEDCLPLTAHLVSSVQELIDVYWGRGDGRGPMPQCIQRAHAAIARYRSETGIA